MHADAYAFVQTAAADLKLRGRRVLEIGSYNVNGSVRPLFAAADYVGIDQAAGPDVDVVSDAASYDGGEQFHVVVSCEALEHAAEPRDIIACAWRALKPGGTFILTAAGEGRAPHNCDGSPHTGVEPYQNITRAMLKSWLGDWQDVAIHEASAPHDIYATAIKPTL